ncbi:GNAT family N-acetyltransferase [Nonomuraea angiospora]|uniref:Ribosomal protein S18 acetylase RimI-like enzyme n=1 Tax=Nonomuraea angiospora TaxID=46172 RepID=A0ABR9LR73_9ACTN|nr:GNAT family N-acetyltransferase [Nonomuraea angiospora]MBE1583144.1 ribosomal protein S18 acetylase RimI-like enzyme [Nonomuraea angiospora]
MVIRELRDDAEVRAACGDDDLLVWAAQGLRGGARAWALGGAVVAAGPGASRRDRLGVWGALPDAVELVRYALAELGPSYRPFGELELVRQVTAKLDGLRESGTFSSMSLPALHDPAPDGVGWLEPEAEAEVAALLAADAPDSYAVPGLAGVRRWAGVRVGGELAAVAADAWPAPSVGLLAGVATKAGMRGRGLADRVCRWASAELLAAYGRAALMVDDDNVAAITVYERIGYRRRRVMASRVAG